MARILIIIGVVLLAAWGLVAYQISRPVNPISARLFYPACDQAVSRALPDNIRIHQHNWVISHKSPMKLLGSEVQVNLKDGSTINGFCIVTHRGTVVFSRH